MSSQSFTVQVNDGAPWKSGAIEQDHRQGAFRAWTIPLDIQDLKDGPDFVSFLFEQAYADPGDKNLYLAGTVRNIRFVAN